MMTETKARTLDLSEPRLAPLRRDDLASFLVEAASGVVLAATPATARLGISVGQPIPQQAHEAGQAVHSGRPSALVRLRLPGAPAPLLFRCTSLDLADESALLFADPAALDAPPAPAAPPADAPSPGTAAPLPAEERAVRFTFEADAQGRLQFLSPNLLDALGAGGAHWIGARFRDLDATGQIESGADAAEALALETGFKGVRIRVVDPALELEIGGVPLFDAARRRLATRGFGVLRHRLTAAPATTDAAEMAIQPEPAAPDPTNVVPFNGGLSAKDSSTFREIARTLSAAIAGDAAPESDGNALHDAPAESPPSVPLAATEVLDILPLPTLLEDDDTLLHANRAFLEWSGWDDAAAVRAAGGVSGILVTDEEGDSRLTTAAGARLPVDARQVAAPFLSPDARLHLLQERAASPAPTAARDAALDLVPWPLLLLDPARHIQFANRAAAERLGHPADLLAGEPVTVAIAPTCRAQAVAWLDEAAATGAEPPPRPLRLRDRDEQEFDALAGLAVVGDGSGELCLVLGPEPAPGDIAHPSDSGPQEDATLPPPPAQPTEPAPAEPAPTDAAPIEPPEAEAAPVAAPQPDEALHRVARRLAEGLGPSLSILTGYAPEAEADTGPEAIPPVRTEPCSRLPEAVRGALATVQHSLDDLSALAEPLAEAAPQLADPAPLVTAAIAHILPRARRRKLTVRPDLDQVPPVMTRPAQLARLIRLMLEEALEAAPGGTAIIVSLACDAPNGDAPVRIEVSDEGPAVDEVAEAAARAPLQPSPGDDRFSRGGRPLRLARLVAEAESLAGRFELHRGLAKGMTAQLLLPR